MRREELTELHYITPMANLPSIHQHGILSHQLAARLAHASVAMEEVQARRVPKVPGGRPLHDYANLYFHARNPMMYLRRQQHRTLCVLRVDTAVLDIVGTVVADRNAAADWVRFAEAPGGLASIDKDLTFARNWTDPDLFTYWRRKSAKCAEVLVPERVSRQLILGAYVSDSESLTVFQTFGAGLPVTVDGDLFFR